MNNAFFEPLFNFQNEGKIDSALDLINQSIQTFCILNYIEYVDELLIDFEEINKLDINLQIGLLVASKPWKDKLTNRSGLFERVEYNFLLEKDRQYVDRVLIGLK